MLITQTCKQDYALAFEGKGVKSVVTSRGADISPQHKTKTKRKYYPCPVSQASISQHKHTIRAYAKS